MPYTIDESFTDSERQTILAALNEVKDTSFVRWSPRVGNENPYIGIIKEGRGCFASIAANLGTGCIVSKIVTLIFSNKKERG